MTRIYFSAVVKFSCGIEPVIGIEFFCDDIPDFQHAKDAFLFQVNRYFGKPDFVLAFGSIDETSFNSCNIRLAAYL